MMTSEWRERLLEALDGLAELGQRAAEFAKEIRERGGDDSAPWAANAADTGLGDALWGLQ